MSRSGASTAPSASTSARKRPKRSRWPSWRRSSPFAGARSSRRVDKKGTRMQLKGINYDTGFTRIGASPSREAFTPTQVRREIEIIARDLHCNAVRISGSDPTRIALAADYALEQGLEVWFAPFPADMTPVDLTRYFAEAAQHAEQLRPHAQRVVFVLGCEMSLFNRGFVPGATYVERMQSMMNPQALASLSVSPDELIRQFNAFLRQSAVVVREHFGGPITYASGPWEMVDWTPFDIVGVDLYRDASNRASYRELVHACFTHQRPVAITEFGCCTFRGAADRGSLGWAIVDRSTQPPQLTEAVVRDQQAQADELLGILSILDEERVNGAFWFTFASYNYPFHADPQHDLDCAAYGVVKILGGATGSVYPDMPWEPKKAFYALADYYARTS